MPKTSLIMDYVDPDLTSTVHDCDIATSVTLLTQTKWHGTFRYLLILLVKYGTTSVVSNVQRIR